MVLHHDDVGLGVVCDVLAGFWGVGGVDAHGEAAATGGTESASLGGLVQGSLGEGETEESANDRGVCAVKGCRHSIARMPET